MHFNTGLWHKLVVKLCYLYCHANADVLRNIHNSASFHCCGYTWPIVRLILASRVRCAFVRSLVLWFTVAVERKLNNGT